MKNNLSTSRRVLKWNNAQAASFGYKKTKDVIIWHVDVVINFVSDVGLNMENVAVNKLTHIMEEIKIKISKTNKDLVMGTKPMIGSKDNKMKKTWKDLLIKANVWIHILVIYLVITYLRPELRLIDNIFLELIHLLKILEDSFSVVETEIK